MNLHLRQSTASQSRALGPFLDDADFKTPETALTIANTDIKLLKNGAASVNKNSGGGTHRVNGEYGVTFDATDSDTVGELKVSVFVAGALLVDPTYIVLEEAVYDQLYAAAAPGAATPAALTVIDDFLDTEIAAILAAVDTEIAAIKAKTDNLPTDPADESLLEAAIAAVSGTALVEIVSLGHQGDFSPGSVVDIFFLSRKAGALTTLASGAVNVYKDNGTTQITVGTAITADFDGVTGLNLLRLTTATDGSLYSGGSNFQPFISAGTVGGTTAVGLLLSPFSLHARSALRPTTAGMTIDLTGDGFVTADNMVTAEQVADAVALRELIAGTVLDKTGYALSSAGIIAIWSAATRELTGFGTLVAQVATAVWGAATRTLTDLGFTVTDVAAIKTKTDFLPSATAGAAGGVFIAGSNAATSITTALTANVTGNLSGSVGSVTGLTATDVGAIKAKTDALPTDPADASVVAGLIAGVDAKVDILDTNVDAILVDTGTTLDGKLDIVKAKTDQLTFTTPNVVDASGAGGGGGLTGPQAAQLTAIEADANTIVSAIDPTGAADIDTILGKVTNLPTDPADQSLLMAAIASVGGGAAPSAAENATAVWAKVIEQQGNITAQQAFDYILAVAVGATGNTGLIFKTPNGAAVRVVATVNALNERTTITLTPSAP